MYKIIGGDKVEYGPVSAEEIRKWVAEKRADGQTMVKMEGTVEWKPLSIFPELAFCLSVKNVPPSAKESPPPVPSSLAQLQERIENQEIEVDIGGCISRGWGLVKENLGMTVGVTFLIFVGSAIAQNFPFIGGIIGLVIYGVLMGGLYRFFLKLIRGETVEIADAFSGFNLAFMQLSLAGIVTGILSILAGALIAFPLAVPFVIQLINGNSKTFGLGGVCLVIGIVTACLVVFILNVLWLFTLYLVIDKNLGFWDAMGLSHKTVMKSPGRFAGLMLMYPILVILGFLACCVGMFVAIPTAIAATTYAYEDIFGNQISPT